MPEDKPEDIAGGQPKPDTKVYLREQLAEEQRFKNKLIEKLVDHEAEDKKTERDERKWRMKVFGGLLFAAMALAAGIYGVFTNLEWDADGSIKFGVGNEMPDVQAAPDE